MRIVLLLLLVFLEQVCGYSDGQVTEACEDMTPHHGHKPSTKDPPYSITADKTQYGAGEEVTVTLSVLPTGSKSHFKGFLLEARNAGNLRETVGSFRLTDPTRSQLLKCGDQDGSAVSHTSDSHKTEMQAVWIAPQDSAPSVQFLATVVQSYKEFWVKVPGPVVVVRSGAEPSPPLTTFDGSIPSRSTTGSSSLSRSFSSEGCGTWKSCLRDPEGCDPQADTTSCHFLSFRREASAVMFELCGPADGYVSFALSLDRWMGNDDVYLCIRDTDRVEIKAAAVAGRTHPVFSSENTLRDGAWRLSDGVIQCSFRRDVSAPADDPARFSLNHSYFLFLAHGRAEDGRTHRHDRQPLVSSLQKDLTGPPEDLAGSRSPLLLKYHGAFMLVSWTSLVSVGVIIARYFKPDWPERTILGQKVWFQCHRMLMLLTVLLTSVGFVLPFLYRGGWSKRAGVHPYLGCVVMAITLVQPVMALFRPAPDASRRFIFNWMHFGTGTVAQVLAIVSIFLGVHQQALFLPSPWSTGVLACSVVWFVLTDLLLELHRRGLLPVGKYFSNVKIYTEHINSDDKEEIMFVPDENDRRSSDLLFKNTVLVVYLGGNLAFLALLLWTIGGV